MAAAFWHDEHQAHAVEIRNGMADALARAARTGQAAKVRDCHQYGRLELLEDGRTRVRPEYRCKQRRVCPYDAREEAGRRTRRLLAAWGIGPPDGARAQFCTLTVPNVAVGGLAEAESAFWRGWDRLRHRKAWRSAVLACSISIETTWNRETRSYNLHAHVALWARSRDAGGFEWGDVQRDWEALTGAPVVDFRPLEGPRAVAEATKYVSKLKARGDDPAAGGGLLDMPPEAFTEWADVFCRPHHQTWRTYGLWRGVAGRADLDDDTADEEAPAAPPAEPVAEFRWDAAQPGRLVFLIHPDKSVGPSPFGIALLALERHRKQVAERENRRREARRKRRERQEAREKRRQEARTAAPGVGRAS